MRTKITNSVQVSGENMFIMPTPQYKKQSPTQYEPKTLIPFSSPAQTMITSSNTMQNSKGIFNSSQRHQSPLTSMADYGENKGRRLPGIKAKPLVNKKFSKLPPPSNNNQIEAFVKNLLDYLSTYKSDDNYASLFLKTKLVTRYEDYMSHGLEQSYFILSLYRMQKELISLICMENESLVINT